jgi:hypothetical protein
MRKILLLVTFIVFTTTAFAQQNRGLCNIEVNDVSKITALGYLIGYTVQFKNNTTKTVDGVYWTAYYYNNDNKLIESEKSSFNSTNLIDPIAAGFSKSIARSPRVKGASIVLVVINKVHYSDGSSCK